MFFFFIDSNPLITSWLKEMALETGDQFYSLTSLKEAAYFLFDLKPDVLVIESEILKNETSYWEEAQRQYPDLSRLPIVTVGKEKYDYAGVCGHIEKPINPEFFFQEVKNCLNLSSGRTL